MDDLEFARKLQEEYDREAAFQLVDVDLTDGDSSHNSSSSQSSQSQTKQNRGKSSALAVPMGLSPVDPSLELSDPNPDIHALFLQFNVQFFWSRLAGIEVKWSPRMTLCAGLCVYEGRGGLCSVRLSLPLLKLRSRKDLVETLLHEMIHAYLFVTDNDRDHDGHGPNFQKHMHRINKETGANISIYHTFHDEVESYQQHWWRCSGPCQKRPPYFGYVKRAMNRAPSAQDFWWAEHQATCGGTYTKIREPEGYGQKKAGKKKDLEDNQNNSRDIRAFLGKGNVLDADNSGAGKTKGKFHSGGNIKDGVSKGNTNKPSVGPGNSSKNPKSTSGGSKPVIVNGVLVRKDSSVNPSPLFSSVPTSASTSHKNSGWDVASDVGKISATSQSTNDLKSTSSKINHISKPSVNSKNNSSASHADISALATKSTTPVSKSTTDNSSKSSTHTSDKQIDAGDEWLDNDDNMWMPASTDNSSKSSTYTSNKQMDTGDEWLDDDDNMWMLAVDVTNPQGQSASTDRVPQLTKVTQDEDDEGIIDLTDGDSNHDGFHSTPGNKVVKINTSDGSLSRGNGKFDTSMKPSQMKKIPPKASLKNHGTNIPPRIDNKLHGKKNPPTVGGKIGGAKVPPKVNGKTKLFGKNFVSVCDGGDFLDSDPPNFRRTKVKKTYILDELDSNDGLWEESDGQSDREKEMSKKCGSHHDHMQEIKAIDAASDHFLSNRAESKQAGSSKRPVNDTSFSEMQGDKSVNARTVDSPKHKQRLLDASDNQEIKKENDCKVQNMKNETGSSEHSNKTDKLNEDRKSQTEIGIVKKEIGFGNRNEKTETNTTEHSGSQIRPTQGWHYPTKDEVMKKENGDWQKSSKDEASSSGTRGGSETGHFTGSGYRLGSGEAGTSFLSQIRKTFHPRSSNASEGKEGLFSSVSRKRSTEQAFGNQNSIDLNNIADTDHVRTGKKLCREREEEEEGANRVSGAITEDTRRGDQEGTEPALDRNIGYQSGMVSCPVCTVMVPEGGINDHLDLCLLAS